VGNRLAALPPAAWSGLVGVRPGRTGNAAPLTGNPGTSPVVGGVARAAGAVPP
jgi:hypothetical protein